MVERTEPMALVWRHALDAATGGAEVKRKCKHCGKRKGEHNAVDMACPVGMKRRTVGYTSYSAETKFEAKEGPK